MKEFLTFLTVLCLLIGGIVISNNFIDTHLTKEEICEVINGAAIMGMPTRVCKRNK